MGNDRPSVRLHSQDGAEKNGVKEACCCFSAARWNDTIFIECGSCSVDITPPRSGLQIDPLFCVSLTHNPMIGRAVVTTIFLSIGR